MFKIVYTGAIDNTLFVILTVETDRQKNAGEDNEFQHCSHYLSHQCSETKLITNKLKPV